MAKLEKFIKVVYMENEIKNCPFCGAEANIWQNYSCKTGYYFVYCKCSMCGAQGKTFPSECEPAEIGWSNSACDSAIKAWNTRVKEVENG